MVTIDRSTDRVHNEKERYVPFSAPPFREGDDHHVKQADRDRLVKAADQGATHEVIAAKAEGEAERHPEWLELVCLRNDSLRSITSSHPIRISLAIWPGQRPSPH